VREAPGAHRGREELDAEPVEGFDLGSSGERGLRLPAGPDHQAAREHRRGEEGGERDPVARVGDVERSGRGEKEDVEGGGGDERRRHPDPEASPGGEEEDGDEEELTRRGGIDAGG